MANVAAGLALGALGIGALVFFLATSGRAQAEGRQEGVVFTPIPQRPRIRHRKLDSALNQLLLEPDGTRDVRVIVEARGRAAQAAQAAILAAGGVVETSSRDDLQAVIALDRVVALANAPSVKFIRLMRRFAFLEPEEDE